MQQKYFKYSLYSPILENVGINIYNCGHQQCSGGHSWGPAIRDYYLIHLVISGKGSYSVGGETFDIEAGGAFIIRPHELVSYTADENNPWEYCWVGFNGADAPRLVELTAFYKDCPVIKFPKNYADALKKNFIEMYQSFGTSAEQEISTISRLFETFAIMIKAAPKKQPESYAARSYIKTAVQYIQRNFSNNIEVSDIANYVGLSRSHLYRIFIKHLAYSPNEYLTQYRISQACTLLRTSELTIGEIASSVGFDDQLYFSRVFKKLKGVSPTQYVKEISTKS